MCSSLRLTFLGANGVVTGSSTLLEVGDKRILIDAGGMQSNGGVKEFEEVQKFNTRDFEFDVNAIDLVAITHFHQDHCSRVGKLYVENPDLKVVSTEPTAQLSSLNIKDGAFVNTRECERMNRRVAKNRFKPIYTEQDVEDIDSYFNCYDYYDKIYVKQDHEETIYVELLPAGHVVGASHVKVVHKTHFFEKSIVFTGDTSALTSRIPFTKSCKPLGEVDYIVSESTYGDRQHKKNNFKVELKKVMFDTFANNGVVFLPTFALHKSSVILQMVYDIFQEVDKFKDIPVFMDSKMAIESHSYMEFYEKFWDKKWLDKVQKGANKETIWNWKNLKYLNEFSETATLPLDKPCVLISSSGMLSGGRAVFSTSRILSKKNSSIVFTGFTPEGTLAHKIRTTNQKSIAIDKKQTRVKANIHHIPFSGHADGNQLIDYIKTSEEKRLKKIMLNHGDVNSSFFMKRELEKHLKNVDVELPVYGEKIKLY